MKLHIILVVVATTLATTFGYKILGIFPLPFRSHNVLAKGIIDALLKAGHEVTWATPYPEQKLVKNLTIIDMSILQPMGDKLDMSKHKGDIDFSKQFGLNVSAAAVQVQGFRDTLVNQQFDAVVTEWFFSDTDAGYAGIQQAPWIVLSGITMHPYMEILVDELKSMVTVPVMLFNFPIPMGFLQRAANAGLTAVMWALTAFETEFMADRYDQFFAPLAKAKGVPLPPYHSALYNISILLVNSHPSVAPALSLPPNVVDIGGYHIDENAPALPKDIQDLLDSSSQGVVYFSLGSIVKPSEIPEKTKKDLVQILGELPYTVLWKFDEVTDLPENVHVRSWWPQASVLAHPNVKLFITHGGLLSTLEAVHYGVPLLAVPVFADQPSNAYRASQSGYALSVPYAPDMGPELKAALKEMLHNDSYYKQAKYLSKLFNNRPVPPGKLISHYVELAIESKGAYHLRSKTHLYPWYQRWMLDLLAALVVILYLLKVTVKILFSKLFRKGQSKLKTN